MQWRIGEQVVDISSGTTASECLRAANALPGALAAKANGALVELNAPLNGDGVLTPVTLADEEGRRIYERSLRFVLLLAVRRLWPGQRVRIEYSAGGGLLFSLPGRIADEEALDTLKKDMRVIVEADLPFAKKRWSLEDALRYFEADGQTDKVALLKRRSVPYFDMYECGGMWEYFYGAMVPSTGAVRVFDLALRAPGMVLLPADAACPERPRIYADSPKHLAVFAQSAKWCGILGVNNVTDLAQMAERGDLRYFIRVNEVLHDQAMSEIAREIIAKGRRVVLVAGPSSSGKTTFAGRMGVHLRALGRRSVRVSLDDYYLNRADIPREPDGSIDLESIYTLDLPLIQRQVRALVAGEQVEVPRYSFLTGSREATGEIVQLGAEDIVILEGIHALNPMLSEGMPAETIHRIFVSALTCLNLDDHNRIRTTDVRLLRRIVRDYQFRGTTPEKTLSMWPSVRRGEETWIFPYQEQADSMFNTALHYELPVLRHVAYDLLKKISPEDPGWLLASRLLKTLNYVPDVDERVLAEIPPLSLLREFIGGSTIDA